MYWDSPERIFAFELSITRFRKKPFSNSQTGLYHSFEISCYFNIKSQKLFLKIWKTQKNAKVGPSYGVGDQKSENGSHFHFHKPPIVVFKTSLPQNLIHYTAIQADNTHTNTLNSVCVCVCESVQFITHHLLLKRKPGKNSRQG